MALGSRNRSRAWNARFRVYVESKDLTPTEVARELGRSVSLVWFWLNGSITPRPATQDQIKTWSKGRVKPDSEMRSGKRRTGSFKHTGTD